MSTSHICPVKDCKAVIKSNLALCPAHYALVPKELKAEMWRWHRASKHLHGIAISKAIAAAEKAERDQSLAGIQQQLL